jgi:hypothetical protein
LEAGLVNETTKIGKARPLGEIEAELLKSEDDYAEADEALRKAKKAREAALESIISCQLELDDAVAQLRSVATPGTRWYSEQSSAPDILNLDEANSIILYQDEGQSAKSDTRKKQVSAIR